MSGSVTYLEAVVMGLVQGVAELFPVSSLGHAVLIPAFIGGSWASTLNMTATDSPYLALVVALHVATACALLVFFRRDWVRIIKGLISAVRNRRVSTTYERLAVLLIVGTIPVGIAGIILDKLLQKDLGKPEWAGLFLALNGVLLFVAERMSGPKLATDSARSRSSDRDRDDDRDSDRRASVRSEHAGARRGQAKPTPELDRHGRELPPEISSDVRLSRLSRKEAAQLGAAQILGLFPGMSRSGSTIVAGLFKGMNHEDAARFAFLLATPAILAAGIYKLPELLEPANSGVLGPAILGSIVTFFASLISVRFLVRYFETRTLKPFAIYCLIVGIGSFAYFA